MQDDVGEAADSTEAAPVVEIAGQRQRTGAAPCRMTRRVAQQGIDAVMRRKLGKDAAGDVPAADNQDFLHVGIVADDQGERCATK